VPAIHYDLCTLESDPELRAVGNATFDWVFGGEVTERTPVSILSRAPIAAAMLGRAEAVRYLVPNQMRLRSRRGRGVLPNRLSLAEGTQAIAAEHLGRASETLQLALLQSVPAGPGKDPVIRVFPAWPKQWDAEYTLLARGAFLVTSSMRDGKIEFVELISEVGGECRLRNPWGGARVTLYRNGVRDVDMGGPLLRFNTSRGEVIVVVRAGDSPARYRRTVPGEAERNSAGAASDTRSK